MSQANDTPRRNLRVGHGRIALGLALVAILASAPAAAEDATAPAEPQAKPQDAAAKTGTAPEDVPELPVLHRFEIPLEKAQALFDDVKDQTFGFDESAFYYLVSLVNRFPRELFKPDEETVAYAQLVATPSAFRGTPVTIRGVYASVTPWRPGAALGLDVPRLFTCNIKEHPAGKNQPFATVVVIDDPTATVRGRRPAPQPAQPPLGGQPARDPRTLRAGRHLYGRRPRHHARCLHLHQTHGESQKRCKTWTSVSPGPPTPSGSARAF